MLKSSFYKFDAVLEENFFLKFGIQKYQKGGPL